MIAYEGNEPYVFISYAHKDKNLVMPIVQGLQNRGFRAWYDGGIEVGNEWPDFIAEHLENCAGVVAFVSRNFGESHNCRQELTFSMNLGKNINVVYLEDPKLLRAGIRMQLSNLHALHYEKGGTVGKLLDELTVANVLSPCRRIDNATANIAQTSMGAQFNKIANAEKKCGVIHKLLLEFAAWAKEKSVSENTTEPTAEELYIQANEHYDYEEYVAAARKYRKAAECGHALAQYELGCCYQNGVGVPQDKQEAARWYQKSAEQGNPKAQYNLGLCYQYGRGIQKNRVEAVRWYQKAADQGLSDAQYILGLCYEHGRGVRPNMDEARKWYQKAGRIRY